LSRKRGGNLDKKRKGRRKAGKRKVFKIVKLVSTAGTGFFYAKKRSRKIADKLQLWKYDPCVKRQVQFKEEK
jgi:large subunit ribosomal protein L33